MKAIIKTDYFILLLPVFFVLHGFTEYFPVIPVIDSVMLLAKYLLTTVLLVVLFYFIFRSWRKATVFSFCIMAANFLFGSVHDLGKKWVGHSLFIRYSFLVPVILLVIVVFVIAFKKSKSNFNRLVNYLNILFIVLIFIDIISLGLKAFNKKETFSEAKYSCTNCSRPDIYLIVADEYAGTKELKDLFQFDNTAFERALETRGFHLIQQPKSNYNYTPFSMASMLNMNFLPPMKSGKINNEEINHCTNYINDAAVIKALKDLGYTIKNNAIFDIDDIPTQVETRFLQKKIKLISDQTFIARLNKDLLFNLITRFKWRSEMKRVADEQLNDLNFIYNNAFKEASNNDHPKFVYTHLMMPHYPYFYKTNGEMNDVELLMEGEQIRAKEYLGYLQYCNKKFLALIDEILKRSKTPPIILFMSDHGFREFTQPVPEQYHFMNINAIYLPNKNYARFYDGMSNVNQFRVLFNTQFQQQLPLLKDSTIFLTE
jgi:hypothetical protein